MLCSIAMRFAFAALCAVALTACARDSKADRAAIDAVVAEFNAAIAVNDHPRILAAFTPNGEYASEDRPPIPIAQALKETPPKRLPWDERTALRIHIDTVRFPAPGLAIVEATQSDSQPTTGHLRRWRCTFHVMKSGGEWKIASYRDRES